MLRINPISDATNENLPRVRDPRVVLALRLLWAFWAALAVLVTIVSIPAYIRTCNCAPEIVATWESMGIAQTVRVIFTALTAINMLILLVLSALIVWRRPDDWMAMFVALSAPIQGIFLVAGPAGSSAAWYQAVRLITNALTPLTWIGLLFLFPNGRFSPSWSKWFLFGLIAGIVAVAIAPSSGPIRGVVVGVTVLLMVSSLLVGLWGLIRRYRQLQTPVQRQQIKWTLWALILIATIIAIGIPIQLLLHDPKALAIFVIFRHIISASLQTLLPVTIAFAMLRYRLWDVDLAVNRTLVGITVTAILGVLFLAVFLIIQTILTDVFHVEEPYIAVGIPAAIAAVAFEPTRKRMRHFIDHNVYGLRYDLDELKAAQEEPSATHPGEATGRKISHYKLLDLLGKGGMGEVYVGVGNDETVAVKLLPHDRAMPDAHVRFEREAQVLTSMDHPNIVKLHDYGIAEGTEYLVMELVRGPTLNAYIKRQGRLPFAETNTILKDIAEALDYIHLRGFIHRDIKPSNVILKDFDETGIPKAVLMDFGLTKQSNTRSTLTASGGIIGTIDYMSPEQIMAARAVDHRTDIYALGVVLYQMLTAALPYSGGLGQVLFAHLQQPTPDPRQLVPDLPREIAHVVLKALAKNPQERYQTAGAFAAAFENSLSAVAIAA